MRKEGLCRYWRAKGLAAMVPPALPGDYFECPFKRSFFVSTYDCFWRDSVVSAGKVR